LDFLLNVGLHYLTLNRPAPSLSGGEAQRIRLASQIGCGLVGVLYILDEPSIGLHPRDNNQLLKTLRDLRDLGNTVIVVEHDEDTMRAADTIVDFGPGPGVKGGEIVVKGTLDQVARRRRSITGKYLTGKLAVPLPPQRRPQNSHWLTVRGARHNNLKNLDVRFPLGIFTCVTGVSGSGKSSLLSDIVREALARDLNGAETVPGEHDGLDGLEHLDKVVDIDQSPIGRTSRSNPSTYVKVLDPIRALFAKLPESRRRGYKPGRFSFNVAGGRCEACEGNGANRLEMDFLADLWVTCPVCEGRRFNGETLEVEYKGASIAQVLDMDVAQALEHFGNQPKIRAMLQTLHDVGMDYVKLGQPSPTLSGGEAQRIKLARELVKHSTGRTFYILDEPTTGLHFDDIRKLLNVLHSFVEQGNTVVVIEHNTEVIKTADHVIDLGPEGGEEGGYLVAEGTPEEIAAREDSATGQVLREVLSASARSAPARGVGQARHTRRRERPKPLKHLSVRGARQHNLKNLDVDIPREQFVVFSGVSGSGKSSLALDTLYAEGQRRYVESLSAYARQFLSQMPKPKVEKVTGLSPAIAIDQKAAAKNPRSTVGTVTEIHDYLRVLFAQLGVPFCPACGGAVGSLTASQVIEGVLDLPKGARAHLLAPVEPRDNESYPDFFARLHREGFRRLRVDGAIYELPDTPSIDRRRHHDVEVLLDRLVLDPAARDRIADSVEQGLSLGGGSVCVQLVGRASDGSDQGSSQDLWYNQLHSCQECGEAYEKLTPHNFSYNSPLGWCETCEGLGTQRGMDPSRVITHERRSLREGAIGLWGPLGDEAFARLIEAVGQKHGFDLDTPVQRFTPEARTAL
ncbi:MAG: excinuclease ABC subunit UvrA, partial [Armatimonadetes bacterium]|nr:excinuclease ABC subunit UvrA [Armatimonadota bacterium]